MTFFSWLSKLNIMGVLFSKSRKTKSRITEVDRQVLTLKLQRDQLVVFRRKLDVQYTQAENAVKMYLLSSLATLAYLLLGFSETGGNHSPCLHSSVASIRVN